jgi:DGQHR domain-containing protein
MQEQRMAVKGKTSSTADVTFDAFIFSQRGVTGPKLAVFVAPVKEILAFAKVDELTPNSLGPQRERKEARVQAIARFLNSNKKNTIPTAIILSFRKGMARIAEANKPLSSIVIKVGKKPSATIVDGQHRLAGIFVKDPSMRVAVVGIMDADDVETAFQFLVINNKASKVPTTHTKALLAKMKDSSLAERLRGARLSFDVEGIKDIDLINSDRESAFYKSIDWSTTPVSSRIIPATGIELALDYLGGLGIAEYDDRDIRRAVFLTMWRRIKETWKPLWVKNSRLVSKVGIICLTRFIADRVTSWADNDELDIDLTNLSVIEAQTDKIVQYMDSRFWTTPWAEKAQGGFDTNQGRDRVLGAITQLFRNGKKEIPWYTDIDIIDRSLARN